MSTPKEVADAKRKYPLTQQIGATGLRKSSGVILEEFETILRGPKGREIFYEMASNDAVVGSLLYSMKSLMRSVEWSVVPKDQDDMRAVEAAEFVEQALFEDLDISWPEQVGQFLSFLDYGFALNQMTFKHRKGENPSKPWLSSKFNDGLWAFQSLMPISQRSVMRWIYEDKKHLVGVVQMTMEEPQENIPLSRCLHFRTSAELANPEGRSILRSAHRSWFLKKRIEEIEAIGIERDLTGYPVLKVPGEILSNSADPDQVATRNALETLLGQIRRDTKEGMLIPSDRDDTGNPFYEFELMTSGGSRQIDAGATILRYDRRIAQSVLADFVMLGVDSSGSHALAEAKIKNFARALGAMMNMVEAELNSKLIPVLWKMNGFDDDIMPKMRAGKLLDADLSKLGEFVTKLAGVGYDLATDTELENALRQEAGLPEAPDREGMVDALGLPIQPEFDPLENVVPFQQPEEEPEPEPEEEPEPVAKKAETVDLREIEMAMKEAAGLV